MRGVYNILKVILSLLFILCLLNMPYGYYQLVRFFGMVVFAVLAYREYHGGNQTYFVIWLASAILVNPIFKIALGRTIWNIVDIIWAVLLLTSLRSRTNPSL